MVTIVVVADQPILMDNMGFEICNLRSDDR
jgi:hypothetical protein